MPIISTHCYYLVIIMMIIILCRCGVCLQICWWYLVIATNHKWPWCWLLFWLRSCLFTRLKVFFSSFLPINLTWLPACQLKHSYISVYKYVFISHTCIFFSYKAFEMYDYLNLHTIFVMDNVVSLLWYYLVYWYRFVIDYTDVYKV